MFSKIVVALDGSPLAERALEVAMALAKSDGAAVAVCSVVDPMVVESSEPPSPALDLLLFEKEADARRVIERAVSRARLAGLRADGQMLLGVPYDEILTYAKREKAGAIVMGSHGRSGIARLFLGSVAEAVLHRAACPVIVVRDPTIADHAQAPMHAQARA